MITYKIISRKSASPLNKPARQRKHLDPQDETYRFDMLQRCILNHKLDKGMRVRRQGSKLCGTITKVGFDYQAVEWTTKHQPKYLNVVWDDGSEGWYTPYEITRKRVL